MELLRNALARLEGGESLALVTVIRVGGSAPRHVGAQMFVDATGAITGTIGGGRVELEVTAMAAEVARGAPARRFAAHLVRDLAMCCGGNMEFYIEPLGQSIHAVRQVLARHDARRPALLVTPLDGGAKRVEELATIPQRRPDPTLTEQGGVAVLVEPVWPRDRAVVFGAGHVSRAFGSMVAAVGFHVVVCDDDETGALSRVSGAPWLHATVDSFDVRDVERAIGPLGPGDHALIMTRDHAVDESILEKLLPKDGLAYLGLIGSRGKIGRFRKRLEAKGVATEERWARLRAPIGLDIGAETPEEIAVAVVAELVKLRRGRG